MKRFTLPLIEVPVSARQIGDSAFQQKAVCRRLSIDFVEGSCLVSLPLQVTMYADDKTAADGYGPALTADGFSTRTVSISTDNNTLVNSEGTILAMRYQGRTSTDAQWQQRLDRAAETDMFQAEFFAELAANDPVRLVPLIYAYIAQADAAGKFA